MKSYLVQIGRKLDKETLWNTVIRDILEVSEKVEIVLIDTPLLAIETEEINVEYIKGIEGVLNVEEDETYDLY